PSYSSRTQRTNRSRSSRPRPDEVVLLGRPLQPEPERADYAHNRAERVREFSTKAPQVLSRYFVHIPREYSAPVAPFCAKAEEAQAGARGSPLDELLDRAYWKRTARNPEAAARSCDQRERDAPAAA